MTPDQHPEADGTAFIDGKHWWVADEQRVAVDVARAMRADLCGQCGHSLLDAHSGNRENCSRCLEGLCTASAAP